MPDSSQDYELSSLKFYRENHDKQLYYNWSGKFWWINESGAEPQLLFHIIGMNATKVLLKTDPDAGEIGYRLNRELGLYCDPESEEVLTHWKNPHGETVSVVHIASRMLQGGLKEKSLQFPRDKTIFPRSPNSPSSIPIR